MAETTPSTQAPKTEASAKSPVIGGWELIGGSWKVFSQRWKELVWFLLIIPVIIFLVALGIGGAGELIKTSQVSGGMLALLCIAISIGVVVMIYLSVVMNAAAVFVVGTESKPKEALSKANAIFWKYLWLMILSGVIVGFGILIFVIPGIIWGVMFAFAGMTLALENLGPVKALKRSAQLVKGFWWTIFARFLVLIIFTIILSAIANAFMGLGNYSFGFIDKGMAPMIIGFIISVVAYVIYFIINFILTSIGLIYAYSLYRPMKEIKEFDNTLTDGMSGGKKAGLAILIIVVLIVIVGFVVGGLAMFMLKSFQGNVSTSFHSSDLMQNGKIDIKF